MKTDLGDEESGLGGEEFALILRVAGYQGEISWLS